MQEEGEELEEGEAEDGEPSTDGEIDVGFCFLMFSHPDALQFVVYSKYMYQYRMLVGIGQSVLAVSQINKKN